MILFIYDTLLVFFPFVFKTSSRNRMYSAFRYVNIFISPAFLILIFLLHSNGFATTLSEICLSPSAIWINMSTETKLCKLKPLIFNSRLYKLLDNLFLFLLNFPILFVLCNILSLNQSYAIFSPFTKTVFLPTAVDITICYDFPRGYFLFLR